MWVFDGEKWVEEGSSSPRSEQTLGPIDAGERDRFYPELQIVEVTRIERRENHYFPILIP